MKRCGAVRRARCSAWWRVVTCGGVHRAGFGSYLVKAERRRAASVRAKRVEPAGRGARLGGGKEGEDEEGDANGLGEKRGGQAARSRAEVEEECCEDGAKQWGEDAHEQAGR